MEAPREQAFVAFAVLSWSLVHSVWSVNIVTDLLNLRLDFGDPYCKFNQFFHCSEMGLVAMGVQWCLITLLLLLLFCLGLINAGLGVRCLIKLMAMLRFDKELAWEKRFLKRLARNQWVKVACWQGFFFFAFSSLLFVLRRWNDSVRICRELGDLWSGFLRSKMERVSLAWYVCSEGSMKSCISGTQDGA